MPKYNAGMGMDMDRLYAELDRLFDECRVPLSRLCADVKALSDLYRDGRGVQGEYMRRKEFRLAYLMYFFPLNVYKNLAVVRFYREYFEQCRTFYDVGCGPLSFFAALALSGLRPDRCWGFDRNAAVAEEGLALLGRLDPAVAARTELRKPAGRAQCVSFGNVLAEVPAGAHAAIVADGESVLSADRNLLYVLEPGTKEAFRRLRDVRAGLCERGFSDLAFCPGAPCPMTEDDWCHENIPFPRSGRIAEIENRTGLDNRFVNFTVLLASTTMAPPPPLAVGMHRVVSNMLLRKGTYAAWLCGAQGIGLFELQKRDVTPTNEAFLSLGRGDIVELCGVDRKASFFRLRRNASVVIKRAFGFRDAEL